MTPTYSLKQIKKALAGLELSGPISDGFVAYSQGKAVVPPVGELLFEAPPGETHIKYGYIRNQDTYVIKIASGFYENHRRGLPSGSGLMLVFSKRTGFLKSILLDEGHLTDVRTAVAGQICARYLAPSNTSAIGVLGTGIQARMQVEYLSPVIPSCKTVYVWGRTAEHVAAYKADMEARGFSVRPCPSPAAVAAACKLIITTTAAGTPLLLEDDIAPGTHITAMGSDTPHKQELAPGILKKAATLVTDSLSQCRQRGEIYKALQAGEIDGGSVLELGNIILAPHQIERGADSVSVADLTGVAVQDVQIATAVCRALETTHNAGGNGDA